jgi:hypothetical protein
MPTLIELRALFGQDEVNHGTERYRVGADGLVRVPPQVAFHLIGRGGFALAIPPIAVAENSGPALRRRPRLSGCITMPPRGAVMAAANITATRTATSSFRPR